MNHSIPVEMMIAAALDAVSSSRPFLRAGTPSARLRAVWVADGVEHDLGSIAGFHGGTSFGGTHATLVLPWADEKNPRTTGGWWQLLVPDDSARVKVAQVIRTPLGEREVPLMLGVPSPGGVGEYYGRARETVEIKMEDVTGVAMRKKIYTLSAGGAGRVDPMKAAAEALGEIPFVVTYPLYGVGPCLDRMPNALMMADDLLITRQNRLNPLEGARRIRYGDRDGRIVYGIAEEPEAGMPFTPLYPAGENDFRFGALDMREGLRISTESVSFALARVNPYMNLASRQRITIPRFALDEVVEVRSLGWRFDPRGEELAVSARRELTL